MLLQLSQEDVTFKFKKGFRKFFHREKMLTTLESISELVRNENHMCK